MDWPSERAACGSFFDPNSTMITTATMRIFHGLSNRSPKFMSVLFSAGDDFLGRVYTALLLETVSAELRGAAAANAT